MIPHFSHLYFTNSLTICIFALSYQSKMAKFYKRTIFSELSDHLLKKQITIITGMRRTGKTTLLKQLLSISGKNNIYFDLDRFDHRDLFSEKNFDNIIQYLRSVGLKTDEKMFIGIDEIQILPQITSVLKYFYDNYNIKFIVTGSSSYYLKNLFTESLSGRKKVFILNTLSFSEYLEFNEVTFNLDNTFSKVFIRSEYELLKNHYENYIKFGGFPEIVLSPDITVKKDILFDILESYIRIDIKSLSDFRDSKIVTNLIKLSASRAAYRIDYAKLSRMGGISRQTVVNYMDLFENTFLITRLGVYSKNTDRKMVKSKKLYFNDNGLLNILTEADSGIQFENCVFNQLKQYGNLSYFSLKSGNEIDFIVNNKYAFESKETADLHDYKKLEAMSKSLSIPEYKIISRNPSPNVKESIWGGYIA